MKKLAFICLAFFLFIVTGCENPHPFAKEDHISTLRNKPIIINVLNNDIRVNTTKSIKVVITQQPIIGTAFVNNDDTITYSPSFNATGVDQFSYEIKYEDPYGSGKTSAKVMVDIKETNVDPTAKDDQITIKKNDSRLLYVLDNDVDQDDSHLFIVSVGTPNHGIASIKEGEYISYTPSKDYVGKDYITYIISDGISISTAKVHITIEEK